MGVDVTVRMRGPVVWDMSEAEIVRELDDITQDAAGAVAAQVYGRIGQNMKGSFKHPTGYYQSRVIKEKRPHAWAVTDKGVIYGPWLEGVGRRNRTTRFKGYASFRRGMQQVSRQVPRIAGPVVDRGLDRLR